MTGFRVRRLPLASVLSMSAHAPVSHIGIGLKRADRDKGPNLSAHLQSTFEPHHAHGNGALFARQVQSKLRGFC